MLSMLADLEKSRSYRYFDDENEDDLEGSVAQSREFQLVSKIDNFKESKLLVVCESRLASAYGDILLDSAEDTPTAILWGRSRQKPQHPVCQVFKKGDHIIVLCDEVLPYCDSNRVAESLIELVESDSTIVCLTSCHISELRGGMPNSDESPDTVRCLATPKFAAVDQKLPAPKLELPNIVSGLTASLLTLASVRGMSGAALINYVELMTVDSLSLEGFQLLFKLNPVKSGGELKKPTSLATAARNTRGANTPLETNLYM